MQYLHQKYNIGVDFKIALALFIVIGFFLTIHLTGLIFGTNSLSVYLSLNDRKNFLESEIKKFHLENAQLQKEYFELKNLEPEQ